MHTSLQQAVLLSGVDLTGMSSYSDRIKGLFRKYGKIGVGVHLTIYAAALTGTGSLISATTKQQKSLSPAFAAGCYLAAENGVKPGRLLQQYGLLSGRSPGIHSVCDNFAINRKLVERELHDDSDPEKRGFVAKALSSGGSSWALAFLCTKACIAALFGSSLTS